MIQSRVNKCRWECEAMKLWSGNINGEHNFSNTRLMIPLVERFYRSVRRNRFLLSFTLTALGENFENCLSCPRYLQLFCKECKKTYFLIMLQYNKSKYYTIYQQMVKQIKCYFLNYIVVLKYMTKNILRLIYHYAWLKIAQN